MKQTEFYYHGETVDNHRFTLCAKPKGNYFSVAASICSKNDNFCRKIGREISKGRLHKGVHFLIKTRMNRSTVKALVNFGVSMRDLAFNEFKEQFAL